MPETTPPSSNETLTPRQRKILIGMSALLFFGGIAIMLFLDRLPLPARLGLGVIDIIGAAVLVVFLRQNSRGA